MLNSKSKYPVLMFLFILTVCLGLIGCSTPVNLSGIPSTPSDERFSPDGVVGMTNATNTVNVDFTLRGYCYAGSNIKDTKALGGFASSDNMPNPITTSAAKSSGNCYLLAQPMITTRFMQNKGMRLLLVNGTKKHVAFSASDSRLNILQEAKDKSGIWRPIEYLPQSSCGNSYHRVILPSGKFWAFSTPRYEGEFTTQIRFCIRDNRNNVLLVSNAFKGSINLDQFTKKQPYRPSNLMDPNFQVIPEKDTDQKTEGNRVVEPKHGRSVLERIREKRYAEREAARKENIEATDCLVQRFKNRELGQDAIAKLQLGGISPLRLQFSNDDGRYELWIPSKSEELGKTILRDRKVVKIITVDSVFEANQFLSKISSTGIKVTAQFEIGFNRDSRKSTILVFQKDQKKALEAIKGFTPKPHPVRPIHPEKSLEGFNHL